MADVFLECARKKKAIAQHGPASLIAEQIFVILLGAESLEIALEIGRVQRSVLEVLVAYAVILVAPGARHRIGDESDGAPVFGGVVIGRDAVFLDGFGRHGVERAGDQIVVVLNAIEQKVGSGGALPRYAHTQAARGAIIGCDAGQAHQHRVNVAALQRQVFNLHRIDDVRDRSVERTDNSLLAFERAGAAGVHVRPVERHDRLAAGKKDAAVLARFPDVA